MISDAGTLLLLHGAVSSGWDWHLVERMLHSAGHDTVAPGLPADYPDADLATYETSAVRAIEDYSGTVIVVAQSMAGTVAPVVAERIGADRIVLLASMISNPGEGVTTGGPILVRRPLKPAPTSWVSIAPTSTTRTSRTAMTFLSICGPKPGVESAAITTERLVLCDLLEELDA